MARALVIGAAGMLGREVTRSLASAGADVVCGSRVSARGWLAFDAEDGLEETRRLLERAAPLELAVNCAGVLASEIERRDAASIRRAERVNGRFPHDLALAADERGARLVHISTDAVFRADAGRCLEDDIHFADDVYGATKRLGEPTRENALSLRCSFVGRDPERGRGLLEWLLGQPAGAEVSGYVDQAWNGLTTSQVAVVCAALLGRSVFERARAEGGVHHLFEDPPLTKYDLVRECVRAFRRELTVVPLESDRPLTRVLGTRHAVLRERLESAPPRAASLEAMAASSPRR